VTFEVGDAWVELEGMVHYAENLTDEPVVLIATSLLEAGEPTAILFSEATPVD
jgi:quercetin dioxygenase-like cupin family protein